MAANLPDLQTLIQAGIDPKTGLPLKMGGICGESFKEGNKRLLEVVDRQDAVNSFTWYNLPSGLSGELIERVLYYKGQGMFFYMKDLDQFFFLPYALDGNIDVYGRYLGVTPLTFGAGAKDEKPWIKDMTFKPIYDLKLDFVTPEFIDTSCVLLRDYTNGLSQTILPRQLLQDPLLDLESDILPYCHTALKLSTGVKGMRVNDQDEYASVAAANNQVNRAALSGEGFVPIIGSLEFQELTGDVPAKCEEYMSALQSIDNYRLAQHGIENGGLFQKKAHMLGEEQKMNENKSSSTLQDRLNQRQHFCDIVNSYTGLGIWCEVSESTAGVDQDMDGQAIDNDPDTTSYEGGDSTGGEDD